MHFKLEELLIPRLNFKRVKIIFILIIVPPFWL